MKKIMTVVLAGVLTVSLLGCSAKAPAAEAPSPEQTQSEAPAGAESEAPQTKTPAQEQSTAPEQSANAPQSGAPEGEAQTQSGGVFGKVKSIVGNEIELELAEAPFDVNISGGEDEGDAVAGAAVTPAQSVTVTVDSSEVPEGMEESGADGEVSGPVFGVAGADGSVQIVGGAGSENKMELEYTGETKSVIIPTGIDIMSLLTGKSAKLEDIKKGSVLMLTVEDVNAERTSAQSVNIME